MGVDAVMAREDDILETLYYMYTNNQKSNVVSAINAATNKFAEIIYEIAKDVYHSCIEDYYSQYTPTSYDRHGDISGYNLYRAEDFIVNNGIIIDDLNPMNLFKYSGKKDKRRKVLNSVINGFRGGRGIPGFPMDFYTRYPNKFSGLEYWHSTKYTIRDIFNEFDENIVEDIEYLFWDYLADEIL